MMLKVSHFITVVLFFASVMGILTAIILLGNGIFSKNNAQTPASFVAFIAFSIDIVLRLVVIFLIGADRFQPVELSCKYKFLLGLVIICYNISAYVAISCWIAYTTIAHLAYLLTAALCSLSAFVSILGISSILKSIDNSHEFTTQGLEASSDAIMNP